jgi:hypothetical protein
MCFAYVASLSGDGDPKSLQTMGMCDGMMSCDQLHRFISTRPMMRSKLGQPLAEVKARIGGADSFSIFDD